MVGTRVLSKDKNGARFLKVLQGHGTLADANDRCHARTTGLVAHVRAIGHVVGTKHTNEELVQKRGFVRRSTGGVENGFVR